MTGQCLGHAGKAGKDGSGWMISLIGLRQSCQEWCTWQQTDGSSDRSFIVSSKLYIACMCTV